MDETKFEEGGNIDLQSVLGNFLRPQQTPEQMRRSSAIKGGAGVVDWIGGQRGQNQAEGDIDVLGAEGDSIREQMKGLKAPGAMDSATTAAAVRNATILGGVGNQQDDSSELAAAKMAMDSGADPANIQRALTEANERKDATNLQKQQGAFNQGLGYAQQDARAGYDQEMQGLGMDYDENQRALQMAQNESLMAQQLKQSGQKNAMSGGVGFLQSGGVDAIKKSDLFKKASGLFGGKDKTTGTGGTGMFGAKDTPFGTGGLEGAPKLFDGSVQGQGLNQDQKLNTLRGPNLVGSGVMRNENELRRRSNLEDIFDYKPYRESEDFKEPFSMDQWYGDAGTSSLNPYTYEQGGVVQKTPGAFKHDDGDGEFQEGENEMILMAQEAGGLVDTGIRQTGGEFVINPKQAKGMEKAYDKIKRKKDPSRQDLMALYEAVRFLDEPQFD